MPTAAMSLALQLRAPERFDGDADLRGPDLLRVVFDPAGARKDLRELLLCDRADAAVGGEDDRAGTRRSLIERQDVGHGGRVYNEQPLFRAGGPDVTRGCAARCSRSFWARWCCSSSASVSSRRRCSAEQTAGSMLSINICWGIAVMMGCYVSAGVTGAHLNPAVTIALAVHRRFPWTKVGPYIVAQIARGARRIGGRLRRLPRRACRVRRRRPARHRRHSGRRASGRPIRSRS